MTKSRALRTVPAAVIMTTAMSWGVPALAQQPLRPGADTEPPSATVPLRKPLAKPSLPAAAASTPAAAARTAPAGMERAAPAAASSAVPQAGMPAPSVGHTASGNPRFSVGSSEAPDAGDVKR